MQVEIIDMDDGMFFIVKNPEHPQSTNPGYHIPWDGYFFLHPVLCKMLAVRSELRVASSGPSKIQLAANFFFPLFFFVLLWVGNSKIAAHTSLDLHGIWQPVTLLMIAHDANWTLSIYMYRKLANLQLAQLLHSDDSGTFFYLSDSLMLPARSSSSRRISLSYWSSSTCFCSDFWASWAPCSWAITPPISVCKKSTKH